MKYTIAILLALIVLSHEATSQNEPVQLEVLAVCQYFKEIAGQEITIRFEVDKNKCDPEIGFISMEERLYHFEDSIKSKGISWSDFSRIMSQISSSPTSEVRAYTYEGSQEEILEVINFCKNQEIKIVGVKTNLVKQGLEAQDEHAICALNKAIAKAELIAANLGYQNCKLIGIDDDSRGKGGTSGLGNLANQKGLDYSTVLMTASAYSIIGHFEAY